MADAGCTPITDFGLGVSGPSKVTESVLQCANDYVQIRARMWTRNGSAVRAVEMYYRSALWHGVSIDMDYLIMQMWLAALPTDQKPQVVNATGVIMLSLAVTYFVSNLTHAGSPQGMITILQAFAAHPLLRAVIAADEDQLE
eukprot:scaffold652048_cov42-Prasinocladus_malaysianus.AAC.1